MLTSVALLAALAQATALPSTDVVRLDVIVRDGQGRPVENLTLSDFELREDGTPQALAAAPLVRTPRVVGIYLDEYYVSASKTAAIKAALYRFVDEDLAAGDQVAILRPLDSLLTIMLTGDHAAMHRAIDAFEGRRGNYEPRTDFERSLVASDRARADVQRAQSTWSTLNALTLHLANLHTGRSSVLLVSEQADPVVRRRGFESLPSSSAITRTANRSNVAIYVFDPRDAAEQASSQEEGPNLLRVLADDSDGALFSGIEAADAGFRQLLIDASSYYMLSYGSARNSDGLFHSVAVSVKRAGVKVRARSGYWAPTPDEVQRARLLTSGGATLPPITLEPPRHASALIRPWFGIARGDNGKIRMTFVWEPSGAVPGDRRIKIPARMDVKAVGSDGKLAFEGVVGDRSSAVFDVPPGRVTFTSTVEDSASQRIDSDLRDVMVRDLKGAVALGTPEIFRGRTARDMRDIRDGASAVPTASREFSRAEQLLVRVPAYPSAQPPAVSATLISPAGQAMRQLAIEPATTSGPVRIDLPLAGLPPGLYSVEIAAKAATGTASETVVFRVR
jgi:Ca-activated chloride channel family protein